MSLLPDVGPFTIQDGALGMILPGTAKVQLKIGVSPKGTPGVIQSAADTSTLTNLFGPGGPLVESAALALQAGGPVYCIPATPSTYGAAGTVTKTVSGGAATMTVAEDPFATILVKVSTGGTVGNAYVIASADSGATWSSPQVSAATVVLAAAPFVTIGMAAGTYVVGDYWTISTAGASVHTGSGYDGVTVNDSCPVDNYALVVQCVTGGALATATFRYSLDGGNNYSGTLLTPVSGVYVIPDTGLKLTLVGTQVAGDTWTCPVTTAIYSGSDLTAAMTAALADSRTWGFCHVVGPAATVAAAATLAGTLQTSLVTAKAAYRFARGIIEVPADTDVAILAAFAAVSTDRVMWAAGWEYVISPLNGRQMLRPSAWVASARASAIAISEDLGYVNRGALDGVSLTAANTALTKQRDENSTPGLDVARFTTLRSILGVQGVYITSGRLGAADGSDYQLWQNGRVMDVFCDSVRRGALKFLNASVRVNADGTIYEQDARVIENWITRKARDTVVIPGDATDCSVHVSRTQNVLSTQTLPITARLRPLGYARYLPVDIGFVTVQAG